MGWGYCQGELRRGCDLSPVNSVCCTLGFPTAAQGDPFPATLCLSPLVALPGGLSGHIAFLRPLAGVAGRWGASDLLGGHGGAPRLAVGASLRGAGCAPHGAAFRSLGGTRWSGVGRSQCLLPPGMKVLLPPDRPHVPITLRLLQVLAAHPHPLSPGGEGFLGRPASVPECSAASPALAWLDLPEGELPFPLVF